MPVVSPDEFRLVPNQPQADNTDPLNAFSVDVEEWFQVGAFENTLDRKDWSSLESRVQFQTEKILHLLCEADVKATFFCLGWVAERYPNLLRQIFDAGHEVGCHGMDHRRIFEFSAKEFLDDISRAKALLEDASGVAVKGYRAPSFSMSPDCWHLYEQLVAAGFYYSSSVVPAKTDHYGAEGLPRTPFFPLKNKSIIEIPMTVAQFGSRTVPASGGGYFRLLPLQLSYWLMKKAYRQTGVGTIFYMHPWEVDPDQPYIQNAPALSRFRHYTGQSRMAAKVSHMLRSGSYGRLDSMLKAEFDVSGIDAG